MATTVNGRKPSSRQVQSWASKISAGKATKIGLEREVFGNDNSRGKLITRLFDQYGVRV